MRNNVGRLGGLCVGAVAASLLVTPASQAASTVTASAPYLGTANTTLNPLSPTYFLETFEDGLLNLPGVSASAVNGSGVQSGPSYSVDADDGTVDGAGAGSYFEGTTAAGIQSTTFFFSPVAGQWPRQVAVAVTGGWANSLAFAAYDTSSNPSGSLFVTPVNGQPGTADDFLVTFTDNAGISAIAMTSNSAATAFQYDHLQFDTAPVPVPEPASLSLLALAATAALTRRRRRRQV